MDVGLGSTRPFISFALILTYSVCGDSHFRIMVHVFFDLIKQYKVET